MKAKEKILAPMFVLYKLPKNLSMSRWFSVLPQKIFNAHTAHFHRGEVSIFYSPKSDTQFMTNTGRSCAFIAPISFYTKRFTFAEAFFVRAVVVNFHPSILENRSKCRVRCAAGI